MNELKKMLTRGELKEAAEWVKESPYIAFSGESELRAALHMLADAILADKPRPGKFNGQRTLAYSEHDSETGATFPVIRNVSQAEWERQIYLAVESNTDAKGRVKRGTYEDVALRFSNDGHGYADTRGCNAANVKRIYEKHKSKSDPSHD